MAHYSDKELGFIQKTMQLTDQHPEVFPANFNKEDTHRGVGAIQKLGTSLYALVVLTGEF
jgi:hypothetical protein